MRGLREGMPASMASVVQVVLLMWLRTTMSYQHVHNVSMTQALQALYSEGGVPRFYRGMTVALVMMPLSRFGDIAANGVAEELLEGRVSPWLMTAMASALAALWRIAISPVDTLKMLLQVHGSGWYQLLQSKFSSMGVAALYEGSFGAAFATYVGHYPWFFVYNFLNQKIPKKEGGFKHLRNALIGLCSSLASDVCSNSIRVVKTYKQTSSVPIGYAEAASTLIAESGLVGFLVRGLGVKLISNAISAMLFTILWKAIKERMEKKKSAVVPDKKD